MLRPHLVLLANLLLFSQGVQAATPVFTTTLWKSPIPVKLDDNFDDEEKTKIREVLENISNNTCIDFVENLPGPQLEFVFGQGGVCESHCGDGRGIDSNHLINIPNKKCSYIHEVMHALGFLHTQQRPDRDNYVKIHKDSIDPKIYESAFGKVEVFANTTDYNIPYDFGSALHYSPEVGAIDVKKPSFEVIDSDYVPTLRSKNPVRVFNDWKAINMHYKCNANCAESITCQNGGYGHPRICTECVCPAFFHGKNCETVRNISILEDGETVPINYGFEWNEDNYRGILKCDNQYCEEGDPDFSKLQLAPPHVIKGPEGSRIRVTIVKIDDAELRDPPYACENCYRKAVEIVDGDLTRTGKKFCCHKNLPYSFLSETNVVGFKMYAIDGLDFTANVTFTAEMPK